jgi:hypothetical protein
VSKTVIRTYLIATIYFYRNLGNSDFFNPNIKELIPFLFLHLKKIISALNLKKYDNLIRNIYTFIPQKIESLLLKDKKKKLEPINPQKLKSTLYPDRFKFKYLKYKKKYLKLKELLDI